MYQILPQMDFFSYHVREPFKIHYEISCCLCRVSCQLTCRNELFENTFSSDTAAFNMYNFPVTPGYVWLSRLKKYFPYGCQFLIQIWYTHDLFAFMQYFFRTKCILIQRFTLIRWYFNGIPLFTIALVRLQLVYILLHVGEQLWNCYQSCWNYAFTISR